MKFINLRKKISTSLLMALFAAAAMFVMPVSVFADDTGADLIDGDSANIIEIDNNNAYSNGTDDAVDPDAVLNLPADGTDCTGSLIPDITSCCGVCCDKCDENCDGTCCDYCTINKNTGNAGDIISPDAPDAPEGEIKDDIFDIDNGNNTGSESDNDSGNLGNPVIDVPIVKEPEISEDENKPIVDPTDNFWNSDENITPSYPIEPIFPDDPYNGVTVPENPEEIYPPEIGDDPVNGGMIEDPDEDRDSENEEEIIYDDLTGKKEDEIIFDDKVITDNDSGDTDSPNSEITDNSADQEDSVNSDGETADNATDSENSDSADGEASDNTDVSDVPNSEFTDNTTDLENPDSNDGEISDNTDGSDNPDGEITDNITDAEDTDNSDIITDEEDTGNPDGEVSDETDEENSDDSDNEALEEKNDVIINVVLPVSISVAINPYNLNTIDDDDFHYSILSPEYSIKNYSNCDVSIVATVSASTVGGIILSPYDLNNSETEFTAFVYIEATNESGVYSDNYSNSASQLAFSNGAVSKEILTLADGSDGETIGYFKINGQAVLPDDAYYSSDAMINMLITFDIAPVDKPEVSDNFDNTVEGSENTENVDDVPELAA